MKKVMIVDDNLINTHILKWMLKEKELEVITFQSHKGIESLLEEVKPNLLIMDIQLDGANGCKICTSLKTNPSYSSLPILLTSSNEEYYDNDCLANGFISKPYNTKSLFDLIGGFI
ncbi:MAG: response regulator [Pedobacter sp.]|nr:MAG: response regulator [Pedobacter sp.]